MTPNDCSASVWANNDVYCKCSDPDKVSEEDLNEDGNDICDAPEEFVDHISGIRQTNVEVQETRNNTYRSNTTIYREKDHTGLQTEDYHTSSGEYRDHGRRQYRRSASPTNYYSYTVSFKTM